MKADSNHSTTKSRRCPAKSFPGEQYTDQEVESLLAVINRRWWCGARNWTLVTLWWRTGLRCAEGLALTLADINFDEGWIRVRLGKGRKMRTVPLDERTAKALQSWLPRRAEKGLKPTDPLFPTHKGRRIATCDIRKLLPRLGRKASIAKRLHCHAFRHTNACMLAQSGQVSLYHIQRHLGHSSLAVTSAYIHERYPGETLQVVRDVLNSRP